VRGTAVRLRPGLQIDHLLVGVDCLGEAALFHQRVAEQAQSK
jgi:hypothetical protein